MNQIEKSSLYVYQAPNLVVAQFASPPEIAGDVKRWRDNVLTHPEVLIFIAKHRTERRYRHNVIAQEVMRTLQDEGIAVHALRREKVVYKRTREKEPTHINLELPF